MNRDDLMGAVAICTLQDLSLGLTLDELLAVPLDAKGLALSSLLYRNPEMYGMVSLIHNYSPNTVISLLSAVVADGLDPDSLLDVLFQVEQPGQRQAEHLLLANALYLGCCRLEPIKDLSLNSFAECLGQGDFTDDAFKWFYVLHLGRMALLHRVDTQPARVGQSLSKWFNLKEQESELLATFQALQAFIRAYPRALHQRAKNERFREVLDYLREIGIVPYLSVEFDDRDDILSLYL